MVKSGLEKIFLKFLHAGDYLPLLHKSAQNDKFSNKNNYLPTWRDFKINFLDHFSPPFLGQKWLRSQSWGKNTRLMKTPRTPLAPQGGSELNCFIYLINIFSFLFAGWPHLDWASVKAGIWCGNWSKSCFSRGSKNPGKYFK